MFFGILLKFCSHILSSFSKKSKSTQSFGVFLNLALIYFQWKWNIKIGILFWIVQPTIFIIIFSKKWILDKNFSHIYSSIIIFLSMFLFGINFPHISDNALHTLLIFWSGISFSKIFLLVPFLAWILVVLWMII